MLPICFSHGRMYVKSLTLLCLMLLSCVCISAQNESLLDEVVMAPVRDVNGNPLNNGVNASQVKFGDWFYMSALHQPFYKRRYNEGVIANESVLVESEYVTIDASIHASDLQTKASEILSQHNLMPNSQKGCAFVVNLLDMSFVSVIPYGTWSIPELEKINTLIANNPNIVLSHVAIIWK